MYPGSAGNNNRYGQGQQQQYYQPQQPSAPQQYYQQPQQPARQGRRKALLVGINYFGQKSELKGCINDVQNIYRFLIQYGFLYQNVRSPSDQLIILSDDQRDANYRPTKQNIVNGLKWLVGGAHPGDSLFFHYSGHGGLIKDRDGDEADGYDSCLYPVDHQQAGPLIDDEIHAICVKYLPPGVRLTVILDCCHSGTGMDLPYVYNHDGSLKKYSPFKQIESELKTTGKKMLMGGGGVGSAIGLVTGAMNILGSLGQSGGSKAEKIAQETRTANADVILFSGCKDSQTSADTNVGGFGATGAMSYAFIQAMQKVGAHASRPTLTYLKLLEIVRGILHEKYSQKPQLSTGHPMDMNQYFYM